MRSLDIGPCVRLLIVSQCHGLGYGLIEMILQ